MLLSEHRRTVVTYCQKMSQLRLTPGTTGNVSSFDKDRGLMAITPSGMDYEVMTDKSVVVMDLKGEIIQGSHQPSSEWPFHLACYLNRSDIGGVVHTHSIYATTFACLGYDIEPVHYMIGLAGTKVPCINYARPGTQELAESIAEEIKTYNAILLANHGLISVGTSLKSAFLTAEQVEFTAEIYYKTKNIGEPHIISETEMQAIMKKLHTYGKED